MKDTSMNDELTVLLFIIPRSSYVPRVISCVMCFQLECFPMLREETERIVTSHIRDRESRAKDQVMLVSMQIQWKVCDMYFKSIFTHIYCINVNVLYCVIVLLYEPQQIAP